MVDTTGAYTAVSAVGAATGTSTAVAGAAVGGAAAAGVGVGLLFNYGYEKITGKPLGIAVYDVVQKVCNGDKQKECEEVLNNIRDVEGKLKAKRKQLYVDKLDLYNKFYNVGSNPGKGGTFEGHVNQIVGLEIGLNRLIQKAKDLGCL